jgi:hypothetical protein
MESSQFGQEVGDRGIEPHQYGVSAFQSAVTSDLLEVRRLFAGSNGREVAAGAMEHVSRPRQRRRVALLHGRVDGRQANGAIFEKHPDEFVAKVRVAAGPPLEGGDIEDRKRALVCHGSVLS